MVSARNIRKFFDDHPEYSDYRDTILPLAESAGERTIIMGDTARNLMGTLADIFFEEVTTSAEHITIGFEDIALARMG